MDNRTKSLYFLIFSLLLLLHHISAELCHPDDKKALFRIKKAFNNAYTFASWTADTDCCTWYIVKCDRQSHRINLLALSHVNDVVGPIPDAVGDLPYLQQLIMHHLPNLTGPIPQSLARLNNLQDLQLRHNNIAGSIPDFLSRMTNLTDIDLSINKLSGTIPPSLSNLHNLRSLFLSRNQLTGSIPDSFGGFKANPGFSLELAKNLLSGPIPKSLGSVNFGSLDLSKNHNLTGDASIFFGGNKGLEIVDLSRNQFSFDITKVVFPKTISTLDLSHNKIYGTLPPSLTEFTNIQVLNVSYNKLCGPIPVGGQLDRFQMDSYIHNKCLCGSPLPPCK